MVQYKHGEQICRNTDTKQQSLEQHEFASGCEVSRCNQRCRRKSVYEGSDIQFVLINHKQARDRDHHDDEGCQSTVEDDRLLQTIRAQNGFCQLINRAIPGRRFGFTDILLHGDPRPVGLTLPTLS